MRASRLLQILLLLQNRGRLTSARLAEELEVSRRTILRDVDALTEAGLPIIVHQGNQGGIELGFDYRTRLTGLAADEALALGVVLGQDRGMLDALGMRHQGRRAVSKLLESLPDGVRERAQAGMRQFRAEPMADDGDPRVPALAKAVLGRNVVTIAARSADPQRIHPAALVLGAVGWMVDDARSGRAIALADCGDINISALRFDGPGR